MGVGLGSLPQRMLGYTFKALFMNESMLILRYKQMLFMAGTGLICRMFVIICTALLAQKYFDLLSLSPSLRNVWLLLLRSSNFWVCGWNPVVLPFKWNLFSITFTVYYLFLNILQNEIGKIC